MGCVLFPLNAFEHYEILIKTKAIAYYMMFLLPIGLLTGVVIGLVAKLVMSRLNEFQLFRNHYKLNN